MNPSRTSSNSSLGKSAAGNSEEDFYQRSLSHSFSPKTSRETSRDDRDIYEEFRSDDGVPYWYHRRTAQTFWERPLHEEEKGSPLTGATLLDAAHAEEPTVAHAAQEGAVRREHQGVVRRQMLARARLLRLGPVRGYMFPLEATCL